MPSSSGPSDRRDDRASRHSRPSKADPRDVSSSQVLIARRAYQIWESNGRPEVVSDQVWAQARAELRRLQM